MRGWLAVVLLAGACGGGTSEVKEDPQARKALSACEETRARQQKIIEEQRRRIAALEGGGVEGKRERDEGGPGPGPGEEPEVSEEVAEERSDVEIYQEFVTQLEAARPRLVDCYRAALKAEAGLQERKLSLQIQMSYAASGEVDAVKIQPKVSRNFAGCARSALLRLELEPIPEAVTFTYGLRLSPD